MKYIHILIALMFSVSFADAGDRLRGPVPPPKPLGPLQQIGREIAGPSEGRIKHELDFAVQQGKIHPKQASNIMRGYYAKHGDGPSVLKAPCIDTEAAKGPLCQHGNPERRCIQCCKQSKQLIAPAPPAPRKRMVPSPAPQQASDCLEEYYGQVPEPRNVRLYVPERPLNIELIRQPVQRANVGFVDHGCRPQHHTCGGRCGQHRNVQIAQRNCYNSFEHAASAFYGQETVQLRNGMIRVYHGFNAPPAPPRGMQLVNSGSYEIQGSTRHCSDFAYHQTGNSFVGGGHPVQAGPATGYAGTSAPQARAPQQRPQRSYLPSAGLATVARPW